MSTRKYFQIRSKARWICLVASLLACGSGCNAFGNRKLVQQLEHENDRLLTEFRAEREKREVAEQKNAQLESRLAESEKLLASQAQGRLSSLTTPSFAAPSRGSSGSFAPRGGSIGTGENASKGSSASPNSSQSAGAMTQGTLSPGNDFQWQRRVGD